MAYAVREYSHWQGTTNPGDIIAVVGTKEEADRLVDKMSTCSFCTPGRSGNYRVGDCYCVRTTKRYTVGYGLDSIDEDVLQRANINY